MQLFREEQRRSTLEMHLNHKVWDATPYISFSSSPTAIEDLAKLRRKRRRSGPLRLVAINPRVRQRKRLPILSVADEMKYYRIRDPYGRDGAYYKDHYVCLWEIAPDEVIGDWDWGQLETKGSWYEDVVLPAFHQHEEVASALSAMPLGCHVSVQQPENHSEMPEVAQLFAGLSSKLMSFYRQPVPYLKVSFFSTTAYRSKPSAQPFERRCNRIGGKRLTGRTQLRFGCFQHRRI